MGSCPDTDLIQGSSGFKKRFTFQQIFVNHVCYGHALMEENVSQRVRNVSVFANRLTFNLTVMVSRNDIQ